MSLQYSITGVPWGGAPSAASPKGKRAKRGRSCLSEAKTSSEHQDKHAPSRVPGPDPESPRDGFPLGHP